MLYTLAKTQNQSESTCIVCKDPILNFITGEVSLINPLVRHNDIEFNNNNVTENQENNTRETNDVCIKQTLIVLLVSMLVLITLTFILALM